MSKHEKYTRLKRQIGLCLIMGGGFISRRAYGLCGYVGCSE